MRCSASMPTSGRVRKPGHKVFEAIVDLRGCWRYNKTVSSSVSFKKRSDNMNNRIDAIYTKTIGRQRTAFPLKARLNFAKYELKGVTARNTQTKVQRQEHRPSEVSRTGAGHQAGADCKSRGLQTRPYQPFHSGLCQHDGAVPAVQCGVCVLYGKV